MSELRFLVTFHGDERTRWRAGQERIARDLEVIAATTARSYSEGSIPGVSVEVISATDENKGGA